jgi:F-type H+-transporting ATPase subunit delta
MSNAEASTVATVFDDEHPEVSRSYAEALINAAGAGGEVDTVIGELQEIVADVLRPHPKFAALLANPFFSGQEKDRILTETFEGRANPTVVRFLRVLNRHGRLGALEAIARAAREVWDRRQNRVPVVVRAAVPLDEGQQASLRDRLARMLGATPILRLEVDPALIGGLVVQVGDGVYDASIRNRLELLRQRLIEGKTHEIQSRRDHFSHSA